MGRRVSEFERFCRILRPDLPAEQFWRAGLRPSGRGGGGISRGSIVRPEAALSRPGTAAGYRAEQPPGDIEAPRLAPAPLASLLRAQFILTTPRRRGSPCAVPSADHGAPGPARPPGAAGYAATYA